MKKSKLFAFLLALIMTLSLIPTAFAADTGGKITITGTSDIEYTVYKMYDVVVVNGGADKYKYKVTSDWAAFAADDYFDVIDGYVHWQKPTASAADGAAIAQLAKEYLSGKSIAEVGTVQVGNTLPVTDNGYYLLVPSDDSACGVVVVAENETVTVTEKTAAAGLPSITKKVLEDSTNTYGEKNTVDIGEKITFQTTITAGGHDSNYVLHDQMDDSLRWLGGGNVTRDGIELVRGTDYTVVDADATGDGCTFHVEFSESVTSTLHEGAILLVNYYAVLEPGSATNTPHINKTWLTHTAEDVKTNEDSTETYTYKVTVIKEDTDGNLLADAGFVLKDVTDRYYKYGSITITQGSSTVNTQGVTWVSEINDATMFTTDATGVIEFTGVDAENFTVVEHVVPGGYTGAGVVSASTKSGDTTVTVTNTLGEALPETGGMGTTLFYVGGGLLMVAAIVLLLKKRRENAE